MKTLIAVAGSLLIFSALSSAESKTYHYPQAEPLPEDSSTNLLRDPDLLTNQNVNITGEQFLASWNNKTNERERIKADMYLLGVLDATEGKLWCGYHRLKSISIHESVTLFFENLPPDRLHKERASHLIIEAMTTNSQGCKR